MTDSRKSTDEPLIESGRSNHGFNAMRETVRFKPSVRRPYKTERKPRCVMNGSKSRSACSRVNPLSMHRVAITVSIVLRTVIPKK